MPRLRYLALLIAAAVAACSGDDEKRACPTAHFVGGLDHMTILVDDDAAESSRVAWAARMSGLAATCDFGDLGVESSVEFIVLAERDAAGSASVAAPVFFVAVADASGKVLAKEIYNSGISLAGELVRARHSEAVDAFIPLVAERDSGQYRILVGFQLTPEQLEFNRQRRDSNLPRR